MEERAGVFIVIEGTDGSGKSTQFELVKKRLEELGHDVAIFKFPRYDTPSSYFVKRYLKGDYGAADDVGPYTSSLFYALDRFEAAPEIRQALSEGKVVLCDRFTGSNMAHQGTKIANAEQRRGFFIWLDNLEFEMLRIPRPDISFILRVPADLSQELMANRENYDIHESDIIHLERTVAVYDDMAQLFPKDFQRIDCVRGGNLLSIETINLMLWEKISPHLPEKPAPKKLSPKSQKAQATPSIADETKPQPQIDDPQAGQKLILNDASSILTQKIERLMANEVDVEYPDIPSIYTPAKLIPNAKKEYEAKTSTLLGLYAKLVAGLAKHGISAPEARKAAGQALPLAATCMIKIEVDNQHLEELIINLINDELPEAQTAGADLFAQAVKANPKRFKSTGKPAKKTAPAAVKALAEEFLTENHIGTQSPVQLAAVWPRNETDLVADMLYEHSSLPLRNIQDRLAGWPINRKLAVFEAYIGDYQPGPALESAHYSWDLVTPYSTFRELQTHPSEAMEIQTLTPRYGYDIPTIIEDAGLSDTFEKCFDLSLGFYSILQQAGHQQEAQYAVLHGHSQRWKMTQNANQILQLSKAATISDDSRKLLAQMQEKLAEAHPIMGETIVLARSAQ